MEHQHTCEVCEENKIHPEKLAHVRADMPDETQLYDLAELFKVFGDFSWIRILYFLF